MHAIAEVTQKQQVVADSHDLDEQQYLTFLLNGETYAISILGIKEIIQYSQVTEVPRLPDFICGVINLRGAVVPMIDLSAHFGKQPASIERCNGIIVIEVVIAEETHSIGVMVDAVNAILDISGNEIECPAVLDALTHANFIVGMSKINGKFVNILNIQQGLSLEDLSMLAMVESASIAELTQVSSYKVALCGNA